MNKIYYAEADDDIGGIYISAPTSRDARKIAWGEDIIASHADGYTNFEVKLQQKSCDGKMAPRTTELPTGTLDMKEIVGEGLAWWSCSKCDSSDFTIDDSEELYMCNKCGNVDEIPYMGL